MCLKRIKGIGREVRLVDASFIWTEEHSRRIKVKITVQKEVAKDSVLQQTMVVEFQVVNQQCEDCQKSFTPHGFNGIIQVRQKVTHRRTFCYLEQLILKHNAHDKVISMKESREGLDFHFAQRSHAQRFADFITSWVPNKQKNSKQLVSHDLNSNAYQYKYTIFCELCPICTDDLVYVPKNHSASLSGAAPLMLVHKVSTMVRLVDPVTLRGYDIPAPEYFKRPLQVACTRDHLKEYIVLDAEKVPLPETGTPQKHHCAGKGRMELADVEIAAMSDFGVNDTRYRVRSHLGKFLKPGVIVLGYNLHSVNYSGLHADGFKNLSTDVILVRRQYKKRRGHQRGWDLQRLARDHDEGAPEIDDEADMELIRQDLEEDEEMRRNVNLYKVDTKPKKHTGTEEAEEDEDEESDEDAPEVPLAELLEGLELGDGPIACGAGLKNLLDDSDDDL